MPTSVFDLVGRDLRDNGTRPVGKITAVYRYPSDLHAPWGAAAVTHGMIHKSIHLVDLQDVDLDQEAVQGAAHQPHHQHCAQLYAVDG